MKDLWKLGAAEAVKGITGGDFSATELMRATLARIEQHNPTLNAITIDLGAKALEQAEQADRSLAAGNPPATLHGVRVTWC